MATSKRRINDEDDEEGDEDMVEETTNEMSRAELKELIYRLKDRRKEGECQIKKLKVELNLMKSRINTSLYAATWRTTSNRLLKVS